MWMRWSKEPWRDQAITFGSPRTLCRLRPRDIFGRRPLRASWETSLTVQGEVAQAVAREIQVKLTPEEKKLLGNTRPVNPKAHDDYLKGRYSCGEETRPGLDRAVQYFQQAIEEAPNDPLAYAGLADCYAIWAWAGDYFAGMLLRRKTFCRRPGMQH